VTVINFLGVILWSSRKGFVNFSADEEEQNSVTRNDHKTRNEEANKSDNSALDVTSSTKVSVFIKASSKNHKNSRDSPASNVVVLFQGTSFSVTSDNHLVEVEGDTESPQEVGQKVIVHKDGNNYAHPFVRVDYRFKRDEESREPNVNTDT